MVNGLKWNSEKTEESREVGRVKNVSKMQFWTGVVRIIQAKAKIISAFIAKICLGIPR